MNPSLFSALVLTLALASGARAAVVARWSSATANGEKIEFYEAFDDARKDARPGVLILHNNLDGVNKDLQMRARKLAEKGYYAIAPKIATSEDFGGLMDGLKLTQEQLVEFKRLVPLRSWAALKILQGSDKVKGRVAVVGYCHLGGPAAMNFAREGADVAAVATLWGGVSPKDMSTAWSRRTIKPKILVLLGGSDVETNPYLASFHEEMRLGKADWREVVYGTASHAFTIPGPHPDHRGEYDPEADRLSWQELTSFLDQVFRSPSPATKPG